MTQPAASKQITALEQRLGIRLVERRSRSVELTPAGKALLAAVQGVIESMERLRRRKRPLTPPRLDI